MEFSLFENRFDPTYHKHLADLLGDIDGLCARATAPPKGAAVSGGKFTKGIQIDFCGLAATTLLGVLMKMESQPPAKARIAENFKKLLSRETTEYLSSQGIYLKIRFIFSYVYSSFAKSLIEAESSLYRPLVKNQEADRIIDYSFNIQSEISDEVIEGSSLFVSQVASLRTLAGIAEENRSLVMTQPEKHEHTLQIRFSPIAMPLCLMIINDQAYADPYMYSQELDHRGHHNLFYHFPIQHFSKHDPAQKKYFNYLSNHFDYQWNNEITMLCKDATGFENSENGWSFAGLAVIRRPAELVFDQKIGRINQHLERKKRPFAQQRKIDDWKAHLVKKLAVYLGTNRIATRKFVVKDLEPITPVQANGNSPTLEIGRRKNGKFYFCLRIPSLDMEFDYERDMAQLVYCLLLHSALAAARKVDPVMHLKHRFRYRIFQHILAPLGHICNKRPPGVRYKVEQKILWDHIFNPSSGYKLMLPDNHIKIGENLGQWINKIHPYEGRNGKEFAIDDFSKDLSD